MWTLIVTLSLNNNLPDLLQKSQETGGCCCRIWNWMYNWLWRVCGGWDCLILLEIHDCRHIFWGPVYGSKNTGVQDSFTYLLCWPHMLFYSQATTRRTTVLSIPLHDHTSPSMVFQVCSKFCRAFSLTSIYKFTCLCSRFCHCKSGL